MVKLSNNITKRDVLILILFSWLLASCLPPTGGASATQQAQIRELQEESVPQVCAIGQVGIHHEVGDTAGFTIVTLPDGCQTGYYFLTAETLEDGKGVVVNGWLHTGALVIRTTFLKPLEAPVTTIVNYQVIREHQE